MSDEELEQRFRENEERLASLEYQLDLFLDIAQKRMDEKIASIIAQYQKPPQS